MLCIVYVTPFPRVPFIRSSSFTFQAYRLLGGIPARVLGSIVSVQAYWLCRFRPVRFGVGCRRMKETLSVINRLRQDGVIGPYAIGGAVGATLYLEPMATVDVDVFVLFEPAPLLLTLTPIYEACARMGYKAEGEAIQIEGWPVQFLAASDPLLAEAVREALTRESDGITTRVMSAEHLMAIALRTGRAKDHARLVMFVEAAVFDMGRLRAILGRYSLLEAWGKFEQRFLQP
ncbi:MAG TPA: hypothetical protein VGI85_07615 [Chthoniobacterales bacterium]|jgi:hypothetical protein